MIDRSLLDLARDALGATGLLEVLRIGLSGSLDVHEAPVSNGATTRGLFPREAGNLHDRASGFSLEGPYCLFRPHASGAKASIPRPIDRVDFRASLGLGGYDRVLRGRKL